jgi:LPS-assembly protein
MRRSFASRLCHAHSRRRRVPLRACVPAWLMAVALLLTGIAPQPAFAQLAQMGQGGQGAGRGGAVRPAATPLSSDQPVTFIADTVEYDRENGLVTAAGHVEAWQNDHVLRADRITFDRNTNVAAARGNVVLMEPDGQVIFADYAELSQGMKDGVLSGMRGLLAQNGRLAANGMRRTDGKVNEFSHVVYSTCDACATDPLRPPLWQLRAASAVQDNENKRIEYYDGVLEMGGVPVGYFPYFSHPDPSVKRASGLLIPSIGASTHIGAFASQPYFWVIDDQSDMTITPMMTAEAGPQLGIEYRRRFNNGEFSIDGSINPRSDRTEGSVFAHGRFNLDQNWRFGFDIARVSSADYIRDFSLGRFTGGNAGVLPSQVYLEGFGQGAYFLLDSRMYQSVSNHITNSKLPVVLPRVQYNYFGTVDPLGGRLTVDTNAFNISRVDGTNTRRAALAVNWDRPFTGPVGDLWKLTLNASGAIWDANDMQLQPNYYTHDKINTARGLPQAALEVRWPLIRDAGAWGSQVIEPVVQVITSPYIGSSRLRNIPNEDSMDLEFTDANLFSLNRFPGIDRVDSGTRANVAMRGAWYLGGTSLDGMFGQSYRTEANNLFPVGSGLTGTVSDYVARGTIAPTNWFDLTYRTRLDKGNFSTRMADATASIGTKAFRVSAGYTYSTYNPYTYFAQPPPPPTGNPYYTPRNEITLGFTTAIGNYRLGAIARRDLATGQMVSVGAVAGYEDECYIFDARFQRRYTSVNNDNGSTTILFQMTFKSVGQFGFRAM